jgi:hypothetical protein
VKRYRVLEAFDVVTDDLVTLTFWQGEECMIPPANQRLRAKLKLASELGWCVLVEGEDDIEVDDDLVALQHGGQR